MVLFHAHCLPILILHYLLPAHADQSCYLPNGLLADSDIQPCNANLVNRPAGSHSACCNLGKTPTDICMRGGLCYRQDAPDGNFMIYAVGCTDATGDDPSCQQYCTDTTADLLSLNPCPDGRWCCNNLTSTSCCVNDNEGAFTFDLLSAASAESSPSTTGTAHQGGATATVTVTASGSGCTTSMGTTNGTSCPHDKSTVVGASVGAALGGSLVALLVALLFVVKRRRKQHQEVPVVEGPRTGRESEWRVEMDSESGVRKAAQEIDGRQVH